MTEYCKVRGCGDISYRTAGGCNCFACSALCATHCDKFEAWWHKLSDYDKPDWTTAVPQWLAMHKGLATIEDIEFEGFSS